MDKTKKPTLLPAFLNMFVKL